MSERRRDTALDPYARGLNCLQISKDFVQCCNISQSMCLVVNNMFGKISSSNNFEKNRRDKWPVYSISVLLYNFF